jgi:hypothetical protein
MQMEYEPQRAMEKVGAMVGMTSPRVEKDLELFREFIERRGTETGTWSGEINHPPGNGDHGQGQGLSPTDDPLIVRS